MADSKSAADEKVAQADAEKSEMVERCVDQCREI